MPRRLLNNKRYFFYSFTAVIVLLIIALVVMPKLKQNNQTKPASKNNAISVELYKVERKDLYKTISLVGQTSPAAQIDIAAKYSGRVVEVNAVLGQKVTAGDILIVQDTGDVDIAIAQNHAGLRQAQADVLETKSTFNANYQKASADYQRTLTNYNRYKSLFEMGAVSREALDNAYQQMINAKSALDTLSNQATADTTPAAVEAKQAAAQKMERAIDALYKQRSDLILRAPRDGVINYRQVEVGSLVQAGQKLMSLVDNSGIYVDCPLSEQDAALLAPDLPVKTTIDSLGRSYKGKIIFVGAAKESNLQTYQVRIELEDADAAIKSGMFARTVLSVLMRPKAVLVPQQAVQSKNGKYLVYVVNNNKVEERVVQLGLQNDSEAEIISGVNEGETIAVSNLAKLRSGITVAPLGQNPGNAPQGQEAK